MRSDFAISKKRIRKRPIKLGVLEVCLPDQDLRALQYFEADCVDDLSRRKLHYSANTTSDDLINHQQATTKYSCHLVILCVLISCGFSSDEISLQMSRLVKENSALRSTMSEVMERFERFELNQRRILTTLVRERIVAEARGSDATLPPPTSQRPEARVTPHLRHDSNSSHGFRGWGRRRVSTPSMPIRLSSYLSEDDGAPYNHLSQDNTTQREVRDGLFRVGQA